MSPTVTALVAQKRNRERASVFLDGEFDFGLSKMLAAELRVGQELTQQEIRNLQQRDVVEQAHDRALHYLSYRPRSEEEVVRYLRDKGVDDDAIESVLTRLRHAGLVNDQEFARFWVDNRETHRPRSRWALGVELRRKGVASDVIDSAVSSVNEDVSAMRAARKVLHRFANLDRDTFYRRLLGRLQRRGFDYGVSRKVVDALWSEIHPE